MRKQNVEERRTKLNENEWDKLRKLTDAYTVIRWISFGTVVAFLTLTGITILLVFLFRIFENGFEIGGLIPFTFFLSTACFLSDPSGIGFLGAVSVFFIVVVLCLLSGREPSAVGALIAFIVLDWITGALSGFIDAGGVEIFGGDFSRIDAYNALSRYDFCDYIEKKPVWKNSGDDGRVRQRLRKKRVKPWRNIQNRNRGIHIRNDILPDSLRFISREGELDGRTGGVPLFAKEFDRIYGGCGK